MRRLLPRCAPVWMRCWCARTALIERMRAEGAEDPQIDEALAKAKLPSVVQVGRRSFLHWPSWWWLNRRERALRAKIARLMEEG